MYLRELSQDDRLGDVYSPSEEELRSVKSAGPNLGVGYSRGSRLGKTARETMRGESRGNMGMVGNLEWIGEIATSAGLSEPNSWELYCVGNGIRKTEISRT